MSTCCCLLVVYIRKASVYVPKVGYLDTGSRGLVMETWTSTVGLIILLIAVTEHRVSGAGIDPNRCRKLSGHSCLEHQVSQNYDCMASNITSARLRQTNFLDTCAMNSSCPSPPRDLHISIYRLWFKGQNLTGARLSWKMDFADSSQLTSLDGFILTMKSQAGKLLHMILNITMLDKRPLPTSETFFYDCLFPIPPNDTWNLSIKSIPHQADSHAVVGQFILDTNGDEVAIATELPSTDISTTSRTTEASTRKISTAPTERDTTTTTATTTTATTTTATTATKATTSTPTSTAMAETPMNRVRSPTNMSATPTNSATTSTNSAATPANIIAIPSEKTLSKESAAGIIIGVLAAFVLILINIFLYFFVRQQKCMKISKTTRRKTIVILDAPRGNQEQTAMQTLLTQLKNVGEIIRLSDFNKKGKSLATIGEEVQAALTKPGLVVLISSDNLAQVLKNLISGPEMLDYIAQKTALKILTENMALFKTKTVTAYFPFAKDFEIIRAFSKWNPLALPRDSQTLVSFLEDPESIALSDKDDSPYPESRCNDFVSEINMSEFPEDAYESGFSEEHYEYVADYAYPAACTPDPGVCASWPIFNLSQQYLHGDATTRPLVVYPDIHNTHVSNPNAPSVYYTDSPVLGTRQLYQTAGVHLPFPLFKAPKYCESISSSRIPELIDNINN